MHAAQLPTPVNSISCDALPRTQDSYAGTLRSLSIAGPAGQLEAVLNQGAPDARFAALVCHPHPLGGGNLHNKVVYHAMKVLNDPAWGLGWPVLRFNFRGTGLSEGAHNGLAETGDVLAGMDWLEREFHLPLIVAGFSFGAAMALRACYLSGATASRCTARSSHSACPPLLQVPLINIPFCKTWPPQNSFSAAIATSSRPPSN